MTPVSVFFSAQIPIADFQRPLCQQLQYEQELNPYLMDTILPRLEREESVELGEIDFDQFDEEDLLILIDYFDWWERLQYPICSLNRRLREIPPSSIKTRVFL